MTVDDTIAAIVASSVREGRKRGRFFRQLGGRGGLRRRFYAFLDHGVEGSFQGGLCSTMSDDGNSIGGSIIVDELASIMHGGFLCSASLSSLFTKRSKRGLHSATRGGVVGTVRTVMGGLSMSTGFGDLRSFPRLSITVATSRLVGVPRRTVRDFGVGFDPHGCSIDRASSSSLLRSFIVQWGRVVWCKWWRD